MSSPAGDGHRHGTGNPGKSEFPGEHLHPRGRLAGQRDDFAPQLVLGEAL
jgi:hypothetical protein